MFEDIKIIGNNNTIREFNRLKTDYIQYSKFKELKQEEYMKNKIMVSKNNICILNRDIQKENQQYKQLISLKTRELNRIRQNDGLVPIFITLTNPSNFHPFVSIKNKKNLYRMNPKYKFTDLELRVTESYKNINGIYRELYKNIKTEYKHIKFVKIIEPHKSLICHLHCLIYVKKENIENIETKYQNILKKHNLKQCKFEILKKIKGCSYITKYILKNFDDKEMRMLDGWKKIHKIRMFTMSNLELKTKIFKKLYFNNKPLNEKIVKEIKSGISIYNNLYEFYTLNTKIVTERIELNGEIKLKIDNRKIDNLFTVYILKQKEKKLTVTIRYIYPENQKGYLEVERHYDYYNRTKRLIIKNSKKELIYDNTKYELMEFDVYEMKTIDEQDRLKELNKKIKLGYSKIQSFKKSELISEY
ncbi:replication endonuclease [Aliarcobacter cryaerophilus]|uniref:replication endonuclease n=1 Tax=Aliarcobacter cryaerophilus TaxID=28198 RepID=UPI0021B4EF2D|nr:replication endonuclease [Aliarcobacter cryaerophilus]MCT7471038.1 replication endonuclease [Aliarcobacter cryaerophilus]